VRELVRTWEELLRKRDQLSRSEELGGELAVVLSCEDVDAAIVAWQGPARATMDFTGGGIAIECKTSVQRGLHHVSQAQAEHRGDAVDSYFLSLWVQEDAAAGRTLNDLADLRSGGRGTSSAAQLGVAHQAVARV